MVTGSTVRIIINNTYTTLRLLRTKRIILSNSTLQHIWGCERGFANLWDKTKLSCASLPHTYFSEPKHSPSLVCQPLRTLFTYKWSPFIWLAMWTVLLGLVLVGFLWGFFVWFVWFGFWSNTRSEALSCIKCKTLALRTKLWTMIPALPAGVWQSSEETE